MRALVGVVGGLALLGCGRLGFEPLASVQGADGGAIDGAADAAAGSGDGSAVSLACPEANAATVAQLSFDDVAGGVVPDDSGIHDGQIVGDGASMVPGPLDCDQAIEFSGGTYVVLPADPAFEQASGSISFWARVPAPVSDGAGIASRDESGRSTPGHLTVWYTAEGRFAARLQDETPGGEEVRCGADQLTPGTWYHVVVNYGGGGDFELWVDGVEQRAIGMSLYGGGVLTCDDRPLTIGLAGNDNPWVLGASIAKSNASSAEPVSEPFTGGAIDHFAVSSLRHDFGAQ